MIDYKDKEHMNEHLSALAQETMFLIDGIEEDSRRINSYSPISEPFEKKKAILKLLGEYYDRCIKIRKEFLMASQIYNPNKNIAMRCCNIKTSKWDGK